MFECLKSFICFKRFKRFKGLTDLKGPKAMFKRCSVMWLKPYFICFKKELLAGLNGLKLLNPVLKHLNLAIVLILAKL